MIQQIIVILIVGLVIGYVIYSLIKSLTAQKKEGCGCSGCSGCELKNQVSCHPVRTNDKVKK